LILSIYFLTCYEPMQDTVRATGLKATGNAHFSASRWSLALEDYKEALACIPQREKRGGRATRKGKERAGMEDTEDAESGAVSDEEQEEEEEIGTVESATEADPVRDLRAVLWANIGACHIREVSFRLVVIQSTCVDIPAYKGTLERRCYSL
jgi:hypothetical protein